MTAREKGFAQQVDDGLAMTRRTEPPTIAEHTARRFLAFALERCGVRSSGGPVEQVFTEQEPPTLN